jgi:hypothetical protein
MNENLAEMVRNESETTPEEVNIFNPDDIVEETNLETEETTEETENTEEVVEETNADEISTMLLSQWFDTNYQNFENINRVRIELNRVRPGRAIITTIIDPDAEEDSDYNRKVCVFEDADLFKVLDLDAVDFHMFGLNKFRIIYDYENDVSIKCYGTKTLMFAVFCNNINGQLIPYHKEKVKPADNSITFIGKDPNTVIEKLPNDVNMEDLTLLYKQISKKEDDINTVQDAVDYFLSTQEGIIDINHLIKIDDILIKMFE